jgi:hypothetical protein
MLRFILFYANSGNGSNNPRPKVYVSFPMTVFHIKLDQDQFFSRSLLCLYLIERLLENMQVKAR